MIRWFSNTCCRVSLSLVLACGFVTAPPSPTVANAEGLSPGEMIQLRDVLLKGLKVRFPDERFFVNTVVQRVQQGKLKDELVKAVYRAAVYKNAHFPFPYFRVMMTKIAERDGVTL